MRCQRGCFVGQGVDDLIAQAHIQVLGQLGADHDALVLRGLEEDGIEVSAIAGTSMGSIVGALYAKVTGWTHARRMIMEQPGQ